jgi:serine/threonine-protein kinase
MADRPDMMVGHYEILDRFARGGTSEIFRARNDITGDLVAIKRLLPEVAQDQRAKEQFYRESELALLMPHKNLIRAFDVGTVGDVPFVVLEWIHGRDLRTVLEAADAAGFGIPHLTRLFIVREILDGLAYAHAIDDDEGQPLGLVHRDLNPQNVFIRFDGALRVADFGASVFTRVDPEPKEVVGSPGYLSPEQASLKPLDRRSDLFAVGCILFELVTGERVFQMEGLKDRAILKAHQKARIPRLDKSLDPALSDLIATALAKKPEDRFSDAAKMRQAIDALMGEAVGHQEALMGLMLALFPEEMELAQQRLGQVEDL